MLPLNMDLDESAKHRSEGATLSREKELLVP
jgi:hypothetical protein